MESYSEIVLDHAQHPRNHGDLPEANARGYQMNPVCGDTLALLLRIDDDRVTDARFLAEGCTASLATSSIITETIKGLSLDQALAITHDDVSEAVGGLPASKLHSAALVVDAVRRAVNGFKQSQSQGA